MFETIKDSDGIKKAVEGITTIALWGFAIIGSLLFLNKLLNLSIDATISLGL